MSARVSAVSVLPTPLGPTSMKTPIGFDRIFQAGLRSADALADHVQRVVLPDDALAEVRFEREHGFHFVLEHLADGDAGPAGDDVADDLRVDADPHQRRFALVSVKLGVEFGQFGAQSSGLSGSCTAGAAAGAPRKLQEPARL